MALTAERRKFESELTITDETRSASRIWRVLSDTANPTETDVLNANGLPGLGTSHPNNFHLRVTSRSVEQIAPTGFLVTLDYTMPDDGADSGGGGDDNPLAKPTDLAFATVLRDEPMDADATDRPVATVNGEPFDPPITAAVDDVQVTISKNFATFDLATMMKFQNKVNADQWAGLEPWTARVTGISGNEIRGAVNEVLYYRVSVVVQIRDTRDPQDNVVGWRRRVVHQGFRVWTGGFDDDGNLEIVHAKTTATEDTPAETVIEPVYLGSDGQQLAKGAPLDFLLFEPYKTANFNDMNLGV